MKTTASLHGIIPPMVTPLLSNTEIDEEGLIKLIEHIISGGVHGIFLLGTTGEAPHLSYELRKEFIKKACSVINKRVPVVVGITDTSITGSLEIAQTASDAGADAVVISAPYYVSISQQEMVEYLEYLVPQLPLPFMMYNMPSCTKLHMSVETVRKAKELGALGIKDSSGDLAYLYALMDEFKDSPDFSIIVGTELFIPETIINGGHGAVPGGANMFPRLFVDLYEASKKGDITRIAELREKIIQIDNKIYSISSEGSKYIKSIKCALSEMGICNNFVSMPFTPFGAEKQNEMKQNISEIDFLEINK
ncbi:dihydrodipicolinate synthase family protein [Prolixibacteraceae bacterium Z1-6]|uniref:Dihydrodipicolinate synthase family protein n=1 Tax=Draconibacterium aestuarii TaxID=2998507 RepID=A0A9X3F5P9_9BACT|nr:dihydrodipicolinate synthase family protein [Prolixibacteraceae bacterium Z1-6]